MTTANATPTMADMAELLAGILTADLPQPELVNIYPKGNRIDLQFGGRPCTEQGVRAALDTWSRRYSGQVSEEPSTDPFRLRLQAEFEHRGVLFVAYSYILADQP